jgi:FKBP-type peptidyl-prolyl cis-trans isomerase
LVSLKSQEDFEKEMQEKQEEEVAIMAAREGAEQNLLANYLVDNNITATPTESGLYIIDVKKGKGAKASKGSLVKVHYTGRLLDGTVFDSSVERGVPIEFPLGEGRVIRGWDEGIAKLKKGGKAQLIIPSSLGYGGQGGGPIPPFSTLVFDVELVDFK